MKYTKAEIWQESKDYLGIIFGLTLYAIGFTLFVLPYQITTGGLAGVAAIIFYATGFYKREHIFPVLFAFFSLDGLYDSSCYSAAVSIAGNTSPLSRCIALFPVYWTSLFCSSDALMETEEGKKTVPFRTGSGNTCHFHCF